MKTLQLSKDSQHYQFMKKMSISIPDNICSYSRTLVLLIALFMGVGVAAGLIAMWILSPWLSFVHSWIYGVSVVWFPDGDIARLSLMIQVLGAFVAAVYFIITKTHRIVTGQLKSEPGLIRLRYRAYRDKVCVKLDFE